MKNGSMWTLLATFLIPAVIAGAAAINARAANDTGVADNGICADDGACAVPMKKTDNTRNSPFTITRPDQTRPGPTDEQKAEIQAVLDKWNALDGSVKNEIYALNDQATNIYAQMIDKYLEHGLITEQQARDLKAKLEQRALAIRENQKIPLFHYKMKRGVPGA